MKDAEERGIGREGIQKVRGLLGKDRIRERIERRREKTGGKENGRRGMKSVGKGKIQSRREG